MLVGAAIGVMAVVNGSCDQTGVTTGQRGAARLQSAGGNCGIGGLARAAESGVARAN
jgi:hypothetical protein